ncbi:hypothetical protein QO189_07430 [Psychrobacter sp. Arc29]|uniref:hypothetical protein n=1 Tax=Psychrobacter sp. Arc29 TaxID=3046690 RepID=UPI00352E9F7B
MITFIKEVYIGDVNSRVEVTLSYADATPEQIAANSILIAEIAGQIKESKLNIE